MVVISILSIQDCPCRQPHPWAPYRDCLCQRGPLPKPTSPSWDWQLSARGWWDPSPSAGSNSEGSPQPQKVGWGFWWDQVATWLCPVPNPASCVSCHRCRLSARPAAPPARQLPICGIIISPGCPSLLHIPHQKPGSEREASPRAWRTSHLPWPSAFWSIPCIFGAWTFPFPSVSDSQYCT